MIKPSNFVNITILLGILILSFTVIFTLSPLYSSVLLSCASVGYFHLCMFFAYPNNFALDPITPIAFIWVSMLVGYGYEYFVEDKRKKKVRDLIAKYVSQEIMKEILADVDKTKLGGKRSEISVLFVDIRNFTHISETTDPEKVSELLNEYFSEMIPIIFKYHGTVNKFIGDALLVIFGAPVEDSKHPEMAVKCAVEIYLKVLEVKEKWLSQNKPEINIGIGISTGEAFVGNIGSDDRFEYTAIGNTVNVANRLETFNKIYKTSILISESTYQRVKDIIEAEEIDSVSVTQNSEPIKIYELKSVKS
jgi:adenylate cyclase